MSYVSCSWLSNDHKNSERNPMRGFRVHWLLAICLIWLRVPSGLCLLSSICRSDRRALRVRMSSTSELARLPMHPNLHGGRLSNGLTYKIFPNRVPEKRFEAHLEILAGSAMEMEHQQGMAHMMEHVAFMGSSKRQRIVGSGSRTNAYTDFQHTVFFAACPNYLNGNPAHPMLPLALDALQDVMMPAILPHRVEKERAAVLSEASMINTLAYRVECQVLSTLHRENRISRRFPIGKEELIRKWTVDDLRYFHALHYRPDNAVLYVAGDVSIPEVELEIQKTFSDLTPQLDTQAILTQSGEFEPYTMRNINRHFPPVRHHWLCSKKFQQGPSHCATNDPKNFELSIDSKPKGLMNVTSVFQHDLLQSFSLHLFSKRMIEPVIDLESLRRDLLRKMIVNALQVRLSVHHRHSAVVTFAEFNFLNWAREGCASVSLDLDSDIEHWKEAVEFAIGELRLIGQFGLTAGELNRFRDSMISEYERAAVESSSKTSESIMQDMMDSEAQGHVYVDPCWLSATVRKLLTEITSAEVQQAAEELTKHLTKCDELTVMPSAVLVCAPTVDKHGRPINLTDIEVCRVIRAALNATLTPLIDVEVPTTLIAGDVLEAKKRSYQGHFLDDEHSTSLGDSLSVRNLSNGIRVSMKHLPDEHQLAVRLLVRGGRLQESNIEGSERPLASLELGVRTMEEGGAFLNRTREEVELFCIDHGVNVDFQARADSLQFDVVAGIIDTNQSIDCSPAESVLQVVHILLTDFKFEDSAFVHAKQLLLESADTSDNNMQSLATNSLVESLTGDVRLCHPTQEALQKLNLSVVQAAMQSLFHTSQLEVSMVGDLPISLQEDLALKYLGTIPPTVSAPLVLPQPKIEVSPLGKGKQLSLTISDDSDRAIGMVAGALPNSWGIWANGSTILDSLAGQPSSADCHENKLLCHSLFPKVVLMLIEDIVNRRLFSYVREELMLTYDANIRFHGVDAVHGGYYQVFVTSSMQSVQRAIKACKQALLSLRTNSGMPSYYLSGQLSGAKNYLINKIRTESTTAKFWTDILSSMQLANIPMNSPDIVQALCKSIETISETEVQSIVDAIFTDEQEMSSCLAVSSGQIN